MMTPESARILRNLTVVSRIQTNEKLSTQNVFFEVQTPSILQPMRRLWLREDRNENIKAINDCVLAAKQAVSSTLGKHTGDAVRSRGTVATELMLHEELNVCARVAAAMLEATHGLERLKTTYQSDVSCVVHIDQLVTDITTFVDSVRDLPQLHARLAHMAPLAPLTDGGTVQRDA